MRRCRRTCIWGGVVLLSASLLLLCLHSSPSPPTLKRRAHLGILVLTSPKEFAHRQLLRNTMLSELRDDARVFFPLGTEGLGPELFGALHREAEEHPDVVLLAEVEEGYDRLALKVREAVAAIAEAWELGFLLKLDADSFVRLDEVFYKALDQVASPRLYWGFLDGRASPKRGGKWKESDWNLCDRFLPYALGGGYVLGGDLVAFIGENRRRLALYANEDVSVGAWLAGLDVRYVHEPRFDTEWKSRGCDNRFLVSHKQSPEMIQDKWRRLKAKGVICQEEKKIRKSYVYNWDVPPSQCCQRMSDPNVP